MTPSSSTASASETRPAPALAGLGRLCRSCWRPQPRHVWLTDVGVALVLMSLVGFPFALRADFSHYFDPLVVASWIPFTLALAVRRCTPWGAFVLVVVGFLIKLVLGAGPHGVDLALLLVLYSSAAVGSRLLVSTSGVASVVLPTVMAAHIAIFPKEGPLIAEFSGRGFYGLDVFVLDFGAVALVLGLVANLFWLAGLVQRMQHRTREAGHAAELAELEYQRTQEQLVVEQERTQIARDMHDVIAHSLAVVVAQADGGRYLARVDPKEAEPVLGTIAETAREALVDVRALLAQLRHSQGDGRQRSLDDLPALVERIRLAGLDVRVRETGRRAPIGAAAEVAVYRLVQEALTNALKYGDARTPTELDYCWDDRLRLRIRNRIADGPPIAAGSGHGLIGMRERILVVGGDLEAGPDGRGSFVIAATVPLAGTSRALASPGLPHPGALADDGNFPGSSSTPILDGPETGPR
ncbi:MAG: sensor histidine kinase [Microbacteriaceae bacterium]|nr:sensor histidine kinase [Microbacteriaceae bacterium]